jgi:hypothetical protein
LPALGEYQPKGIYRLMTEIEFSQKLRRGLGDAIIELKENPDRARYQDIVLRCCLRDISYDWQSEGTKGRYLYSAICALGVKDHFGKILSNRFLSRCPDRLFSQLADILSCYASDGSEFAKDAFRKKYSYFASKNGRMINNVHLGTDEGFQWEKVACCLLEIDGFSALKSYAINMGELLRRNPYRRTVLYYDWFISAAEDVFGKKRTRIFVGKMRETSDAAKTFIDTLREEDELSRKPCPKKTEHEKITVDFLRKEAKEAALHENPRYKMLRYRRLFAENASDAEVLDLAQAVLREENETDSDWRRFALPILRNMIFRKFPVISFVLWDS